MPAFWAGLLDDRLGLLARLVDRGLVEIFQLLAVLLADAVGALLPARLLQNVDRLVDVELVLRVLGAEAFRIVDEVGRRPAGAAVDVLLDRVLVDQQGQRLAHRRIAEAIGCLVLRLERSPSTSVHGSVLLSWMCSMKPASLMIDAALAALLQAREDLVLDLHVPGEVELAGLQHGARRRHRVAAALHLDGVEVRPVLDVVVRVDHAGHHVARLEVLEHVGTGADRLEVGRRLARLGADVVGEQVLGNDHAGRSRRTPRPRTASAP